jgi:hypothetical protein
MKKILCIALLATSCGQQTRLRVSTNGAEAQTAVVGETVHRVLRGSDGKVLFAYDLEAKKMPDGLFRLQLKPSQQKPTFEKERAITVGWKNGVQVDLMEKPGTGQKITDLFYVGQTPTIGGHLMQLHNHLYKMVHGD